MAKLPRGVRNNNPLNIRYVPSNKWQGLCDVPSDGAFCRFTSMLFGFRAALKLVRRYILGGDKTVSGIIQRWAPPSENSTSVYIQSVVSLAGVPADGRLDFADRRKICKIVRAMAIVENGPAYAHLFPLDLIVQAYEMV